MRRAGDADIRDRHMDGGRRLWRAVVEQVLHDARRHSPNGLVIGARMEFSAAKAAVILEARALLTDRCQAEDLRVLLDLADMAAITLAAHKQIQVAIDTDGANLARTDWYMTSGG